MRAIICGAGQVGYGIAEHLAAEDNDITVIDPAAELIQRITDELDVRGVVGHGSHPDILEKAGAGDADMLIAVTFADEINMMACQVAHSLFATPTKIARVRAQAYLDPAWQTLFSRDHMPIDAIISPEVAVAKMAMRRLALPGAFETIGFVDNRVIALGITCEEACPVVNTPLKQLSELFPDLRAVVVGIVRDGRLFVPHGQDQMLTGDAVYVIAESSHANRTLALFGHDEKTARRILIVGGGNIGFHLAQMLEDQQPSTHVRIIEAHRNRAEHIAEQLKRAIVLNGSAVDLELLREAGADETEAFIAVSNDDRVNILSSVMARHEGASRAMCLINNPDFASVLKPMGIDTYINPKAVTVSAILQYVRRGRIRAVYSIQNGAAEVMEAEALQTSPLVGKPLREASVPEGVRIGALVRDDEVIIPRGHTEVRPHDTLVMFALADQVREVEHMFRVSLEYF